MLEAMQKKLQDAIEGVLVEVDGDDRTHLIGFLVGFSISIAARRFGWTLEEAQELSNEVIDTLRRHPVMAEMAPSAHRVVTDIAPIVKALLNDYPRAERAAACTFMIGMATGELSNAIGLTPIEHDALGRELESIMRNYLEQATARDPAIAFGKPKPIASS